MDVDEEEKKAAADEDANEEDWCGEDCSGTHSSGGGRSLLSFGQKSLAAFTTRRAADRVAKKNTPHVLSRSQKYRNIKKLLGQAAAGMARSMEVWLRGAQQQQQQQQQEEEEEKESSSAGGEVGPLVDSENSEVAPHARSPGGSSACGDADARSGCISVGDMSMGSGHGLGAEEWCSLPEMKDAEEVLENYCDTSPDNFLDGLDFCSSSSSSSSGGGGGGGGSNSG